MDFVILGHRRRETYCGFYGAVSDWNLKHTRETGTLRYIQPMIRLTRMNQKRLTPRLLQKKKVAGGGSGKVVYLAY